MLEVFIKFICFVIMAITGFVVLKTIIRSEVKLFNIKTLISLMIIIIIQMLLYRTEYTIIYTIMVFLLNILVYKSIFKISIEEIIVCYSIFTMFLFFSDLFVYFLMSFYTNIHVMRDGIMISLVSNFIISILCIKLISIKPILLQLQKFYNNLISKKFFLNIIIILLIIIDFCCIAYNFFNFKNYNEDYILNFSTIIIFIVIAYSFIKNKNNYIQLSEEYDSLFNYIQNFEDWIEKEQFNRHEYKNQLAVLRCLTSEKKVKDKIDEILEDNISIEGDVVHKLKDLPKGGLKGLMYYKVAIAQKNKINITIDVSLEKKSLLKSLNEQKIRVLCKLIGVYFDNAIEAARVTRKKSILIEIYELKDKVNIVISNTFRKTKKLDKRNEKGVTTKGKGHGNGLYFASNLISKNNWIESRQDIIDGYYIQQLTIKKQVNYDEH